MLIPAKILLNHHQYDVKGGKTLSFMEKQPLH